MVAKVPGRDQRAPMERLVRIAAALRERGSVGEAGDRLAQIAGFDGDGSMDQLKRDIRSLTDQGWQIDNIAGPGEPARYRMRTVDNRLRVRLTPPQQRALQRAILVADRNDLIDRLGLGDGAGPGPTREAGVVAGVPTTGHDASLATVLQAVRLGSVLRFTYKGTPRVVHPESVRSQNGTWYLRGQENTADTAESADAGDSAEPVKAFVVARMSDIAADRPRSARPVRAARHPGLHPMSWEIDPPVEVTLRTSAEHEPDVRRWLGEPAAVEADGDGVVLRYVVTHRSALRARLYELGRRVVLLGPEDVRRELLAELRELKGGD